MKVIEEGIRLDRYIERNTLGRWLSLVFKSLAEVQDKILCGDVSPDILKKLNAAMTIIKSIQDYLGTIKNQMNLFEEGNNVKGGEK